MKRVEGEGVPIMSCSSQNLVPPRKNILLFLSDTGRETLFYHVLCWVQDCQLIFVVTYNALTRSWSMLQARDTVSILTYVTPVLRFQSVSHATAAARSSSFISPSSSPGRSLFDQAFQSSYTSLTWQRKGCQISQKIWTGAKRKKIFVVKYPDKENYWQIWPPWTEDS